MAVITSLPGEVISNITNRVDLDDLQSFRLACRSLEQKSFHNFAREYFSVKGIIFTTDSLKALIRIARSPRLGKHLHALYVLAASFCEEGVEAKHFGCGHAWKPTTRNEEAYSFYLSDQAQLKESGCDVVMLSDALSNLTALKHVAFTDTLHEIPPGTDVMGYAKATRRAHLSPVTGGYQSATIESYRRHRTHVFRSLIKAIARSSSTSLQDFSTYFRTSQTGLFPSDLKYSTSVFSRLKKSFNSLEHLRLVINTKIEQPKTEDIEAQVAAVAKFAYALTPLLSSLDLGFTHGTPTSGRALGPFLQKLNLTNLKHVKLQGFSMNEKPLSRIMSAMNSVETLTLASVNIAKGTWPPVLKAISTMGSLEHLHIYYVREDDRKVYFLPQADEEELKAAAEFEAQAVAALNGDGQADPLSATDVSDPESDTTSEGPPELGDLDISGEVPKVEDATTSPPGTRPASPEPEPEAKSFGCGGPLYIAPGEDPLYERGYYVCLIKDAIRTQIPNLINNYNIGGTNSPPAGFQAGNNGGVIAIPYPDPMGLNLAAYIHSVIGTPGPLPAPLPNPGNHGGGTIAQATATQGNQGTGQTAAAGANGGPNAAGSINVVHPPALPPYPVQ